MLKTFLKRLFTRTPKPAPVRRRMRPSMELLEDRSVPAVFEVNTLLDTVDADPNVTSLREAITAANAAASHDSIAFAAGLSGTIQLASILPDLDSHLAIWGPGADLLTVRRDTGGSYRIFAVTAGHTVTIAGLTISNGLTASGEHGGGIANSGTLTLSNCIVSDNRVYLHRGGGIYNDGTLTVTNCTLSGNLASGAGTGDGGGIYNAGTLTVTNSTLSDNSANGRGGGIANWTTGTLTVVNTTISGNETHGWRGGAIYNIGAATVTNSTLWGNAADSNGGGIHNAGTLTVINSTLSGNLAGADGLGDGGGLDMSAGSATLMNVTITANRALGDGGGIFQEGGTLTLHNTLVAGNFKGTGNSRGDIEGTVAAASSFNLIGDGSGLSGIHHGSNGNQVGDALEPIDPRLRPLVHNGGPTLTHALRTGSPALDHGHSSGAPATDQRGVGRFGAPDVGAFELPAPLGLARVVQVTSMVKVTKGVQQLMATGRLRQKVTLVNKTGQRIQGPISLVLDKLTVGVRLWQPTGRTKVWAPLKSFYLNRLPGDGILDPGEKLTFVLEFVVPPGATTVAYKVRVLAGKGPR